MKFSKEMKIGTFVVVVLVLTFFIINFLRGKDIFNKEIDLTARFENVQGLLPSAPVNIRGFKAGSVTDVVYDRKSDMFRVECSVKKQFVIPEDSRIVIYSTDIMGGKGVRIELGNSIREVKNGSVLAGGFEKDLIATVTEGISPIMNGLTETVVNLNALMKNVNSIVSDENKASVSATLAHARKAMSNLESLSESIEGKSPEIEKFIESLSGLSDELSSIVASADTVMANVSDITVSVKESEIFEMVSTLKELLEKIQDPDGLFGRMMKDDKVYDSVDSLVTNVTDLIGKMKENPKKYMKLSVF